MELRTRLTPATIETERRKADQPDTYPKGRHCAMPGCITLLSVYTRGPKCNQHTPRSRLIRTIEDLQEWAA
jgi:hypothetical protein